MIYNVGITCYGLQSEALFFTLINLRHWIVVDSAHETSSVDEVFCQWQITLSSITFWNMSDFRSYSFHFEIRSWNVMASSRQLGRKLCMKPKNSILSQFFSIQKQYPVTSDRLNTLLAS